MSRLQISKHIFKNLKQNNLKLNCENYENIFFFAKKNAIILVLPIEKISLWPEPSSPPRFKI